MSFYSAITSHEFTKVRKGRFSVWKFITEKNQTKQTQINLTDILYEKWKWRTITIWNYNKF